MNRECRNYIEIFGRLSDEPKCKQHRSMEFCSKACAGATNAPCSLDNHGRMVITEEVRVTRVVRIEY